MLQIINFQEESPPEEDIEPDGYTAGEDGELLPFKTVIEGDDQGNPDWVVPLPQKEGDSEETPKK